jgi:hypothetical protein
MPDTPRAYPRTSMFVLASMVAPSVSGPVKIRNMSPGGALIEGAALPHVGEHLSLGRGELSAAGTIVWCDGGRAGLRFDHYVEVGAWLPTGGRQQQVDQTFHELKNGLTPTAPAPAASVGTAPIDKTDLLDAARALDALADALAEDAQVIASHSTRLQALDIASQLLRRCARYPATPG